MAGKVEKERRLQGLGNDLAPVNRPVEGIEFTRVVERVQNKRSQAEDIKVRGPRSCPAAEQHIKSNRKVNQRNQPQSLVKAAVGGL
jgi:hypothetical protein